MTSLFDAKQRRQNSLDVALDFLACGLDPQRSVFFKAVRRAGSLRAVVAAFHAHADGFAGAGAPFRISRLGIPINHGLFSLSRADGGGHFDLRLERRSCRRIRSSTSR